MQFSDFHRQIIQQQIIRQQIIQEGIYLWQEIALKRTQRVFSGLCFFLLSQGFTIPILPIGPWAMWPCISDFAVAYLIWAFLLEYQEMKKMMSSPNRSIFHILVIVTLAGSLSYIFYASGFHSIPIKGANFGAFQVYRLYEFVFVFWVAAAIPLDYKRLQTLKKITAIVLLFVCIGIILTFFSIVPLTLIGAHLPKSIEVAGPWVYYSFNQFGNGWGTIGYNHAYVSVQVILLIGFYLHLDKDDNSGNTEKKQRGLATGSYLMLSIIACFFTGSRNGFAMMLILALVNWIKRPIYAVITIAFVLLIFPFLEIIKWGLQANQSADGLILDRQLTIFNSSNPDNLSGRDEIWQQRLDVLDAEPLRWIFGTGFGSAIDSGNFAHLLPLHITIETGLLGLCLFTFLFWLILFSLHRYEDGSKSFLFTTIVLLLSSLSQETFYPVPALGHFLGFYLFCLAISLRSELTVKEGWLLNTQELPVFKATLGTAEQLKYPD